MSGITKQPKQIECPEARHMIKNKGGLLLDVRSHAEFSRGSIPGAVNLPLQKIHEGHVYLDKKRPIIVCCVSGNRSAQAQTSLNFLGFDNVHNLGSIRKYLTC